MAKTQKLQKIAQSPPKNRPSAQNLAHPFARRSPQPGAPLCTPLHEGPPTRRTPLHPFARRLHEGWGDFCHQIHNFGKRNHFFSFLRRLSFFCSLWAHGAFFWLKRFCRVDSTVLFKGRSAENPDQTALAKCQRLRNRDGSTPVGQVFRAQAKSQQDGVEFRSLTRSSQDEEDSLSPQKTPDFPTRQFRDTFLRLSLRFQISAASLQNCKSTSHFRLKLREAITY